jgi:hypothetical protein
LDAYELYRAWLEQVWGTASPAPGVVSGVVSDDFVGHWPGGDVRGVDGLLNAVRQTHEAFDEISFALDVGPFADGSFVAARWLGTGVRDGEVTRFVGHDLLRVDSGRVVELWPATVTLER